jgi:hypothetical protein
MEDEFLSHGDITLPPPPGRSPILFIAAASLFVEGGMTGACQVVGRRRINAAVKTGGLRWGQSYREQEATKKEKVPTEIS